MASAQSKVHFFGLPREIRDKIYDLLIADPEDHYWTPLFLNTRNRVWAISFARWEVFKAVGRQFSEESLQRDAANTQYNIGNRMSHHTSPYGSRFRPRIDILKNATILTIHLFAFCAGHATSRPCRVNEYMETQLGWVGLLPKDLPHLCETHIVWHVGLNADRQLCVTELFQDWDSTVAKHPEHAYIKTAEVWGIQLDSLNNVVPSIAPRVLGRRTRKLGMKRL